MPSCMISGVTPTMCAYRIWRRSTTFTMDIRALSSPGCGVMQSTPTSAVSSASSTGSGASFIGRGPKSSRSRPVNSAPRSANAFSRLAATLRLISSAIKATCSPGCTPRHTSMAFSAPAISSIGAFPKAIFIILPDFCATPKTRLLRISLASHFFRSFGFDAEGRDLPAAAGDIRQAAGAQPRQEPSKFSAKHIRRQVHQHVPKLNFSVGADVGELAAPHGDLFLHNPAAVLFRRCPAGKSSLDRFFPVLGVHFPPKRYAGSAVFVAGFHDQVLLIFPDVVKQRNRLALIVRFHVFDNTRPWHVLPNHIQFVGRE